MRVLLINSVCGTGSTGRICADIAREYENNGDEVRIAFGRSFSVPERYLKFAVPVGSPLSVKINALKSRFFDNEGLNAKNATKKFLKWADEYDPDLLWLHNLHGYYINYELLFKWIKSRPRMKVKWTLHDCWAFTGHCTYFSAAGCDEWTTRCIKCPQRNQYPKSLFLDNCKRNFDRKKSAFCGVEDMTLITPSKWLADLVKKSFLKDYPVEVRYNAIDKSVFKPTPSAFREKYWIGDKTVVLGVASVWDRRKGFDDFIKLSEMLDGRYVIVLVGLNEKQMNNLPDNVIGIARTDSVEELAGIYTAADVFLNLTYEDNYPTVNLESQACGTPCVTYRTGGSVESVPNENVVDQGDLTGIVKRISELIL